MSATPWTPTQITSPSLIFEVPNSTDDSPTLYALRYSSDEGYLPKDFRYRDEVYRNFGEGSEVLLLGAGHPSRANFILRENNNISKLTAIDYTPEATVGLDDRIAFLCLNFLIESIPGSYDYVFSSHTMEHFSRSDILNTILPKCKEASKKAVVFIVPYGDNWGDEPSHKCRFYEYDELCALSSRWKRIHGGQELVLWFDTN